MVRELGSQKSSFFFKNIKKKDSLFKKVLANVETVSK